MSDDYLCQDLKFSIRLVHGVRDELELSLTDDLSFKTVLLWYPIGENTINRRYHLRESMVIAMRRLVAKGVEEGLISDSPGESTPLNIGITLEVGRPPDGLSITFLTDEELL